MTGHIKIDRKILNWEWYQDINVCRVFIHLLLIANYKDGRWKGAEVKRGQVITGRLKLALVLKLSEKQIRICLNKLKETNEITIKSSNRFSTITICKYDTYQSFKNEKGQQEDQQEDQQRANRGPTEGQQRATNNKENNVKNDKEEKETVEFVFWENEKKFFLNAGDWIYKFCIDKHIGVEVFDTRVKIFLDDLELKEDYKSQKGLKRHFTNWHNRNYKNGFLKNGIELSSYEKKVEAARLAARNKTYD